MKKTIFALACLLLAPLAARAGDIKPGSVPGSINYQGRLEMDNAPITGPVHLYFRIYTIPTGVGTGSCGGINQPCLWQSPETIVTASQGIFSATLYPPLTVFSSAQPLYLEVQVEGDILSPREPLSSVAYALVSKKLEDGASVSASSFTAAFQVLLATDSNSNVGIGTDVLPSKLTVDGSVMISGSLCFTAGGCMTNANVGSAVGGVTSVTDSIIESGHSGTGDMYFKTGNSPVTTDSAVRMKINDLGNNGTIAIGPAAIGSPKNGALDIDGTVFVSTWGISERSGGPVPINGNLLVPGGRFTGANSEYLSVGEVNNVVALVTGNGEGLRVHSNGFVGVNTTSPGYRLDVNGDIHTNTGLLASDVSAGAYGGAAPNEIRATGAYPLLLQQNSQYNVGIGTDTPTEKLQVKGSIRAEKGIIASTAAFSGAVSVGGDFTANSGNNVILSTTTIYGTLMVSGGIGSMAGFPAYIASTQTFTGLNTFAGQVTVSSDIVTPDRLGVAMKNFAFAGSRYLQIGDTAGEYSGQDTLAYLIGGANANAKLEFYRGGSLAGGIETQNGANLATVIAGQAKTLTDSVYHRIQNSVVWISTGMNTTPAVYVSSRDGNVGIGTTIADPNYKMTLNGVLHIVGDGNGIVFPNGSFISSNTVGTAVSISNAGDALVMANTSGGGGSVILRSGSVDGLVVDSGGNIGVGTLYPTLGSKMNVRGGDLVLGTPVNPYPSNGVEDLIVAGSIVFDGALIQRSAIQTQLSGLVVAGNVYLSTGTAAKTGVGTNAPITELDVNGDAQFGLGVTKSTFTQSGALQLASPLAAPYGGTGMSSYTTGDIVYASGAGTLNRLADVAAGSAVVSGGAGAAPVYGKIGLTTHVSGTLPVTNGGTNSAAALSGNSIMVSNGSAIVQGAAGTTTTLLHGNAAGTPSYAAVSLTADVSNVLPVVNGGTGADLSAAAIGGLIYKSAAGALGGTGALYGVVKATNGGVPAVMTGTPNTLTKWTDNYTVGNSVITDDGTTVSVNTHKITNVVDPGSAQDAATKNYVDGLLSGGLTGTTWNRTGNTIGVTDWLGSINSQAVVIKTANTTAMTITTGQVVQLAHPLDVAYGGTGNSSGNIPGNAATVTTNANLTGDVTSVGNATTIASLPAISGANLTNLTAANISYGTAGINISGNAGTVTTNANLTGDVHSAGNATTIVSLPVISGANLTNLTAANISAGTANISISGNAATSTKPLGGGSTNHAVCWKSDGSLGFCNVVVDSSGVCGTCN